MDFLGSLGEPNSEEDGLPLLLLHDASSAGLLGSSAAPNSSMCRAQGGNTQRRIFTTQVDGLKTVELQITIRISYYKTRVIIFGIKFHFSI